MFIDVGLLFLQHPVDIRPFAILPAPNTLTHRDSDDLLVGAGFGYYKREDSTFAPDSVDGFRRQWRLHNISLVNDLWLSTECDTVTNLPFMSMFDSGAPLFLGDNVVVGIWSYRGKATKPCPYSSCAIRIDNPKVLAWIKERIKTRLGIDLSTFSLTRNGTAVFSRGKYTPTGNRVELSENSSICSGLGNGTYTWSLNGSSLRFTVVADGCVSRKNTLTTNTWTKE